MQLLINTLFCDHCYNGMVGFTEKMLEHPTQLRIIGAVRGAHSQLWGTVISVCSLLRVSMTGDLAHLQLSAGVPNLLTYIPNV